MSDLRLILNNQITVPLSQENINRLELDFSFDNFSPNQNLVEDIVFVFHCTNDEFDVIGFVDNWIENNGVYAGIPFAIQDLSTNETYFTGVVDLGDVDSIYDKVTDLNHGKGIYSLKFKPDVNNIFDIMAELDLRSLNWSSSDFRQVETVLNRVPDTSEFVSLSIVLFLMTKELSLATLQLSKAITDAANGLPTGPVISGLKIFFAAAYFVAVVFAIYELLQQISDAIFSKIKNYYVIEVETLLTKACASFGYSFGCSILDKFPNLVILPRTNEEGAKKGNPTNNPVPNKTLLQQLQDLSTMWYAKIKVNYETKVIQLENIKTYFDNPLTFDLADLYNANSFSYNLHELNRSIKVRFLRDTLETNTYLRADLLGVNFSGQEITSNGNQINVNYDIIDADKSRLNLQQDPLEITIPYARGYRKNFQSDLEKFFNTIYDNAGRIKSVFGTKQNGSGKVGDRIGRLLLSNNWVAVDKIFMLNDIDSSKARQLSTDSFHRVHAEYLFDNYISVIGLDQNQWLLYTNRDPEPICNINFAKQLRFNNICRDYAGRPVLVESNIKNMGTELHEISYRRQEQYIPSEKISITKNYDE